MQGTQFATCYSNTCIFSCNTIIEGMNLYDHTVTRFSLSRSYYGPASYSHYADQSTPNFSRRSESPVGSSRYFQLSRRSWKIRRVDSTGTRTIMQSGGLQYCLALFSTGSTAWSRSFHDRTSIYSYAQTQITASTEEIVVAKEIPCKHLTLLSNDRSKQVRSLLFTLLCEISNRNSLVH